MSVPFPQPATPLTDRHFRSIAELIEGHVGIRLPAGKRSMLEGRLQKRVRALKLESLTDYVEMLFDDRHFEAEFVHLIDCVTTNKTDFFREPSHFDYLRNVAIPEIMQRRGRGTQRLKLWSAACSTGMEAYTIAIVLAEMQREGANFDYAVLGTDISTQVLQAAEEGIYAAEMVAPVPADAMKRYFMTARDQRRREYRVVPELRRRAHFMRLNLMDASYAVDRDVDVIFCRNVLIYFDRPTQQKVVERLTSHLRPGGYFMVGHSESMVHNGLTGMRQVYPTIFRI